MSFFDSIGKMAESLLPGVTPEDASKAAGDHVSQMDPNELAGHLTQSVGSMDQTSLMALGQQLLHTFTNHDAYSGDGAQAAREAGTTQEAVAGGSPDAVASLIAYAKSNPQVLQAAANAFMQKNPGALTQLAPGLLSGIMSRLSGGATS